MNKAPSPGGDSSQAMAGTRAGHARIRISLQAG
jgi:hypothetical protein